MENLGLVELKQEELREIEGGLLTTGVATSWLSIGINFVADVLDGVASAVSDASNCICK